MQVVPTSRRSSKSFKTSQLAIFHPVPLIRYDGRTSSSMEDKKNGGNGRKLIIAVPPSLRRELIGQSHSLVVGGHLGSEKTLAKINQRYFWPRMGRHVKGFVKTCLHCQFRKPTPGVTPGLLEHIRPPERPFQMVDIDHVGSISSSKEGQPKHIIVAMVYLSKWIEARAVKVRRPRKLPISS